MPAVRKRANEIERVKRRGDSDGSSVGRVGNIEGPRPAAGKGAKRQ